MFQFCLTCVVIVDAKDAVPLFSFTHEIALLHRKPANDMLHLPGGDNPQPCEQGFFRPALTQAEAQRKPGQVRAGLGSVST
jgi:hypothetical protein